MRKRAAALRHQVIERAVRGPGMTGGEARRAAYENSGVNPRARDLLNKVARQAWTITDEDVAATRAVGFSEDEIFELTICAALGQANRQLNAAIAALDAAAAGPVHDPPRGAR